jgi:hypothetical protein
VPDLWVRRGIAKEPFVPLTTSWVRRCVVAGAGLLAAGTLAGCGTGTDAQTNEIYNPAVGVNARSADVNVLNLLVVADPDGSGTVSTALVNQSTEPDQLTAVTASNEGQELTVDAQGLPLDLEAGRLTTLETASPVFVQDVAPGYFLTLSLTFANSEPVQIDVPVVERTDMYASVPTAPGIAEGQETTPTSEPTEATPTEPTP